MADSIKGQKDTLKDKLSNALHKITGGQSDAELADASGAGEAYSEEGDFSGSGGDADFSAAGEEAEDLSAAGEEAEDLSAAGEEAEDLSAAGEEVEDFSAAGEEAEDFSAAGEDAELADIDGGVRSSDDF